MDIEKIITSSIEVKQKILKDKILMLTVFRVTEELLNVFCNKKKLLLCGNGGSAADAQHIAAEFSGRFYLNRKPLDAEALHVNTSYITSVANDYSFDDIYSRLINAKGMNGDMLFAFSTSGKSKNIINAINAANDIGITTVGFTGSTGGHLNDICKFIIKIPSDDTPRIQEAHILIGHIISEIVEKKMFQ